MPVPGQLQWRSIVSVTLQIAALVLIALAFFMRMPQVSGLSMAPHITSGETVLINTIDYRLHAPARGDIIAFRHDNGSTSEVFIKRVVGLPGDRVRIDRGTVYVNGVELNEPYVQFKDDHSYPERVVPAQSLYVLGDNRAASDDSRYWGFVTQSDVIGKAIAGVWPLRNAGAL
jgi:signal peptidase I